MPDCPIVDTHLHLWDPRLIRYPWLRKNSLLDRPYLLEDFHTATGLRRSRQWCLCSARRSSKRLREIQWAAEQARLEPRLRGMVAWAPLEKGRAVIKDLERLQRYSLLRGIRRVIQFEPDLNFCLRPNFIEGIRALKNFDLSFDICIDHRHLANVVTLARVVPEVPMILDHIGKPAIRNGERTCWAEELRALARCSNVVCKTSGVATEADPQHWTAEQLRPYIETTMEEFGEDRIMFGGDWPVSSQAIGYMDFCARQHPERP
jgi:L-fuconolactonase